MFKYKIDIRYSKIDEVYIAEVPELSGCIAHGNTYHEAIDNAEEAIKGWLKVAKEFGWSIPDPLREQDLLQM